MCLAPILCVHERRSHSQQCAEHCYVNIANCKWEAHNTNRKGACNWSQSTPEGKTSVWMLEGCRARGGSVKKGGLRGAATAWECSSLAQRPGPPTGGVSQLRWRADQHPQKRFKYLVLLLQRELGTLLLVPSQSIVEARAAWVAGQRVSVGLREPRVVGVAEEVLHPRGNLLHPAGFFLGWSITATGIYCSQPHVGEEGAGRPRESQRLVRGKLRRKERGGHIEH